MNQITEEEFLEKILDRDIKSAARDILQQLELYIGISTHHVLRD